MSRQRALLKETSPLSNPDRNASQKKIGSIAGLVWHEWGPADVCESKQSFSFEANSNEVVLGKNTL